MRKWIHAKFNETLFKSSPNLPHRISRITRFTTLPPKFTPHFPHQYSKQDANYQSPPSQNLSASTIIPCTMWIHSSDAAYRGAAHSASYSAAKARCNDRWYTTWRASGDPASPTGCSYYTECCCLSPYFRIKTELRTGAEGRCELLWKLGRWRQPVLSHVVAVAWIRVVYQCSRLLHE